MKVYRPLIHIGYPKCASTWLQEAVFSHEEFGFSVPWGSQADVAIDQFAKVNSLKFSAKSVYEFFEEDLKESVGGDLVPVLSQEMLSGNPTTGKYWSKEVADRIHEVFPKAKILIVIREQKSILLSWYKENIKNGRTETLERFLGKGRGKLSKGFIPQRLLEHLEYNLLISYYQHLFGNENVLTLSFELLREQPQDFISRLFAFVELAAPTDLSGARNVGYGEGRIAVQRVLNHFTQPSRPKQGESVSLPWLMVCKISVEIDQLLPQYIQQLIRKRREAIIATQVKDMFYESNRKTSELIDIYLGDLGYDC